jgi:uncharacterized membrane protein YfcA
MDNTAISATRIWQYREISKSEGFVYAMRLVICLRGRRVQSAVSRRFFVNELVRIGLLVCPMIFLAGFVDAIAGGGGLISLPALLLAGLPAHYAIGTHKTAMSIGTFIAAGKYIRAKKADLRVGLISAAGSAIGALGGSTLALRTSDSLLRRLMLAILPLVAVFLLVKRDFGKQARAEKPMSRKGFPLPLFSSACSSAATTGLSARTGTFFILAFTALMGFDCSSPRAARKSRILRRT